MPLSSLQKHHFHDANRIQINCKVNVRVLKRPGDSSSGLGLEASSGRRTVFHGRGAGLARYRLFQGRARRRLSLGMPACDFMRVGMMRRLCFGRVREEIARALAHHAACVERLGWTVVGRRQHRFQPFDL